MATIIIILLVLGIACAIALLYLLGAFIYIEISSRFGRNFTAPVREIIMASREYALTFMIGEIDSEILLYAIIKNEIGAAHQVLKTLGFKSEEFVKDIEDKYGAKGVKPYADAHIILGKDAERCLVEAFKMAARDRSTGNSVYVLIALVSSEKLVAVQDKYQSPAISSILEKMYQPEFMQLIGQEKRVSTIERLKAQFT